MILHARVRDFRHKHKLSQKEMAELLHIDATTVAKWESNTNKTPQNKIYALCCLFKEDPYYFFGLPFSDTAREILYSEDKTETIYHTGFLVIDRQSDPELEELVSFLNIMVDYGKLTYLQRKKEQEKGKFVCEYIAVRIEVQPIAHEEEEEGLW